MSAVPAFGAHNAATAGDVLLDDVTVTCETPMDAPKPPHRVVVFDRVLNDKEHKENEATVDLPADTKAYGRIIATLELSKPPTRFDPWDRLAFIHLFGEKDEPFELLRYITPYHGGWLWRVDVTHFRPLLQGKRRFRQRCGTQGPGWLVSLELAYYPGPADRHAFEVRNLWRGKATIGDPDKPVSDFYTPKSVPIPEGTAFAEVRTVVTGHGMSPNSNNAAEFMPIDRTLAVNGRAHVNKLWKTDNYLNPCRPQGGTWKYDRAGWAPGDVVRPWVVDATAFVKSGKLDITYALAPYVNENRGKTWAPFHQTESQVVFYRKAP